MCVLTALARPCAQRARCGLVWLTPARPLTVQAVYGSVSPASRRPPAQRFARFTQLVRPRRLLARRLLARAGLACGAASGRLSARADHAAGGLVGRRRCWRWFPGRQWCLHARGAGAEGTTGWGWPRGGRAGCRISGVSAGVRVYGRSDCCEDRLAGFNVYVGNHNYEPDTNAACAVNQAAPEGPNFYVDVECTSPLTGTYLFIQVPGADKILTLCEVQVRGEELPPDQGGYDPWGISNQGNPRPDQLPIGASRNTWANIVNNKKNVLWCVENFHYLGQRERCIHGFTGGPLLAKDPHVAQAMLASAPLPPAERQLSSE